MGLGLWPLVFLFLPFLDNSFASCFVRRDRVPPFLSFDSPLSLSQLEEEVLGEHDCLRCFFFFRFLQVPFEFAHPRFFFNQFFLFEMVFLRGYSSIPPTKINVWVFEIENSSCIHIDLYSCREIILCTFIN